MKLLYVSSGHPLQEADDCLMWEKLGIDWFSTGYYSITDSPGDLPTIHMKSREDLLPLFQTQSGTTEPADRLGTECGEKNRTWTNQVIRNQWRFTQDFIEKFDVIFFNFFVNNVSDNLRIIKHKTCFLKTYSMHPLAYEPIIQRLRQKNGLKVVRNSPYEHMRMPQGGGVRGTRFGGYDFVIRGSVVKDEHEVNGWTGEQEKVCTFSSYLVGNHNNPVTQARKFAYLKTAEECGYQCDYFGIGNNFITHTEKLKVLREYRANLVVGTPNASNTYSFVEAWIMGQPLVVFGRPLWYSPTYEPDTLITHGQDGFIGNSPQECASYIKQLMNDHSLAKTIGANGRARALTVYGRETLAQQWRNAFNEVGYKI